MDKGNRELPDGITETPALTPELTLPAPRWRSLSALIAVSIIVLVITGVLIYSNLKYARLESELNRYENLWNEQAIPNYDYTIEHAETYGGTPREFIIQIRTDNGIITSKTIFEDGDTSSVTITEENISFKQDFYDCNTVEKLFTTIRDAIEKREGWIEVTYNQSLGYPMHLLVAERLYMWGYSINVTDFCIIENGE